LLQELIRGIAGGVQGILRESVVIVGTPTNAATAFMGGVITTVGNFLPGPLGNLLVNPGTNLTNAIAEALRAGPYADPSYSAPASNTGESCLAVFQGEPAQNLPVGQKLVIREGQGTILKRDSPAAPEVVPISTLLAQQSYRDMIMSAVKTAASSLATDIDNNNTQELTRALAAVVQVASAADPVAAQSMIQAAVGELTKGGKYGADVIKAVATIAAAAANGSQANVNTLSNVATTAAAQNGAANITPASLNSATTRFQFRRAPAINFIFT
jgi:hypothetical protein